MEGERTIIRIRSDCNLFGNLIDDMANVERQGMLMTLRWNLCQLFGGCGYGEAATHFPLTESDEMRRRW